MTSSFNGDGTDHGNTTPPPREHLTGLYNHETMKDFVLNKPGDNSPATGPKLNSLSIDAAHVKELDAPEFQGQRVKQHYLPVSNDNYHKIAKGGAEFIGINGNINLQVKHALDEAFQTDKLGGMDPRHKDQPKSYKNVDQLLAYMNDNLKGTYFSVAREQNRFALIDSRYNEPKANGNVRVQPSEMWDMGTKKYVDLPEPR